MDESIPLALESAHKSLALDDNIAESYLAIGRMKLHYEWKVSEAQIDLEKALAINPNSAECHVQLCMCAVFLGKSNKVAEHSRMAVILDPFSPMTLWMASAALVMVDPQTALENGKRIIDLNSEFFFGHWIVGNALILLGRHQEAFAAIKLAAQLEKGPMALSSLGSFYGLTGDKSKALEVIRQLESMQGIQLAGNNFIGDVYASIGELDKAFLYYDKAVELKEPFMLWKKLNFQAYPELKKDPRTRKLLDRIEVPH